MSKHEGVPADGLPMQTRAAAIGSINEAARTIELVWTTGARVARYDWVRDEPFEEELVVTAEAVDLSRLLGGAPLLPVHNRWELGAILGVVEAASIANGEGRATVRFAKAEDNPDADKIFRMVKDGIIRQVSVGYVIRRVERLRQDNDMMLWRVIDWQPYEISLVPVGADPNACVRDASARTFPVIFLEDRTMSETPASPPAPAAPATTEQSRAVAPEAPPAVTPPAPETRAAPTPPMAQEHAWTAGEMQKVQARAAAFGLDASAAIEVMASVRSLEDATDALQARAAANQSKRQIPQHRGADTPKADEAKRSEGLDPSKVYARRLEATRAAGRA
ncbi:MAG: HK97 family phage prohead protease [Pseudomonadota bacterium]